MGLLRPSMRCHGNVLRLHRMSEPLCSAATDCLHCMHATDQLADVAISAV
jgi:hypothetical protein